MIFIVGIGIITHSRFHGGILGFIVIYSGEILGINEDLVRIDWGLSWDIRSIAPNMIFGCD